jgi:hypothetical protein
MNLLFSVLVERVIVDETTHQTSLISVVEELTVGQGDVSNTPVPGEPAPEFVAIPMGCSFVMLFEVETEDEKTKTQSFDLEMVLAKDEGGDSRRFFQPCQIEFGGKLHYRAVMAFEGIPYSGPGRLLFRVLYKSLSGPKVSEYPVRIRGPQLQGLFSQSPSP